MNVSVNELFHTSLTTKINTNGDSDGVKRRIRQHWKNGKLWLDNGGPNRRVFWCFAANVNKFCMRPLKIQITKVAAFLKDIFYTNHRHYIFTKRSFVNVKCAVIINPSVICSAVVGSIDVHQCDLVHHCPICPFSIDPPHYITSMNLLIVYCWSGRTATVGNTRRSVWQSSSTWRHICFGFWIGNLRRFARIWENLAAAQCTLNNLACNVQGGSKK